jgi:hypothetical protein
MGGFGSGRGQSGKDTTSDYRALDVRRLQRDGLLTPGRSFGWNWTRDGETVASIQVRAEADRVILNYRHKSGGSDWQPMDYPVQLEWTPCTWAGGAPGFSARHGDAGGAWRCCISAAPASSRVGTATSWPMPASGKPRMIVQRGGPTGSGAPWLGAGHSERRRRQAQRNALAHLRAATRRAQRFRQCVAGRNDAEVRAVGGGTGLMTCSTTAESVSQNAESRRWRDGGSTPTEPLIDSGFDSR